MTLEEYYEKYKNIKKLHPAPKELSWSEAVQWRRKFVLEWQAQLSEQDRAKIKASERSFNRRMSFYSTSSSSSNS